VNLGLAGRNRGGKERKKTISMAKMFARKQTNVTQFLFTLCSTQLVNSLSFFETHNLFIPAPTLALNIS
jgi:hypothetical protein